MLISSVEDDKKREIRRDLSILLSIHLDLAFDLVYSSFTIDCISYSRLIQDVYYILLNMYSLLKNQNGNSKFGRSIFNLQEVKNLKSQNHDFPQIFKKWHQNTARRNGLFSNWTIFKGPHHNTKTVHTVHTHKTHACDCVNNKQLTLSSLSPLYTCS